MDDQIYELFYRSIHQKKLTTGNVSVPDKNTNIKNIIRNILKELSSIDSNDMYEFKFSDVGYCAIPVFDDITQQLLFVSYKPVSLNKEFKGEIEDFVKKYNNFDITNLPLIDVAKYLDIKVKINKTEKAYGFFSPSTNTITICSDYAPTFLHELSHAIDILLGNFSDVKEIDEVVAELSSSALCKIYHIPINMEYTKYYLDVQAGAGKYIGECSNKDDIDSLKPILKRVEAICEYVIKCKEVIYSRKNGT
jgi:hypothetical protein